MAMTSVSVIITVCVLNLHHRGPNDKPLPSWLRKLFLRKTLKKAPHKLCFNRAEQHYVDEYFSEERSNYVKSVPLRLTIENLAQELKEELDLCSTDFGAETAHTNFESRYTPTGYIEVTQTDNSPLRRPQHIGHLTGSASSRQNCSKTNEEILNALQKILVRYERDDSVEEMIYEWRQVALAVDRILFWIFLVGTTGSTVLVLIVAPITKFF